MIPSHPRRSIATLLILATALIPLAPGAKAAARASLSGRVLMQDGVTPRPGAVVNLVADRERVYTSAPTGPDGGFRVDPAPEGNYEVLVETTGGAFLAEQAIDLQAGDNTPLALRLGRPNYQTTYGLGSGAGMSKVAKWLIVGGITLAGAFVFTEVAEDDDERAVSPF